jgi:hypothetical protein
LFRRSKDNNNNNTNDETNSNTTNEVQHEIDNEQKVETPPVAPSRQEMMRNIRTKRSESMFASFRMPRQNHNPIHHPANKHDTFTPMKSVRRLSSCFTKPAEHDDDDYCTGNNNNNIEHTESACTINSDIISSSTDGRGASSSSISSTRTAKSLFFELLNSQNPYEYTQTDVERKKFFQTISTIIKEHPKVCSEIYEFEAFPGYGIYPLHMLCALNAPLPCIKRCLSSFKGALQDCLSEIGTALHYSCYFAKYNLDIVQYMIMKSPNCLVRVNKAGRTPFMMACLNPNTDVKQDVLAMLALLQFTSVDRTDCSGNTALHLACSIDTSKTALKIIECIKNELPKKVLYATNQDGSTPLHIAVANPKADVSVLKTLICSKNVAAYLTNRNGQNPLHIAVTNYQTGDVEGEKVIQFLAKKFPKTLSVQDSKGQTPYDIAKSKDLGTKILKLLKH